MENLFANEQFNTIIIPLIIIAGFLLAGLIIYLIVFNRIKAFTKKTNWDGDNIIIASIGKAPFLWFFLAGIYFSLNKLPFDAKIILAIYQLLFILMVASVAIVFSRMIVGGFGLYAKKNGGVFPATSIFELIIKGFIFALAAMIILQTIGISITPLLTALGVGGLAIALALQDTLTNLFSGIYMIASRKFQPGDYIELDSGNSGYIHDISWRNTTIKTLGNNLVILPNSKIAASTITNYSRPQGDLSVLIEVGVSYDSDLEMVEKIVKEVASKVMKENDGGVKDFEPIVRYHTFGESSIVMTVVLRVTEFVNQYLVKHEFVKALHKRFKKEGIVIPFPQRVTRTVKD